LRAYGLRNIQRAITQTAKKKETYRLDDKGEEVESAICDGNRKENSEGVKYKIK